MGALVSHIGGYGIPAIPTQPATAMFSHRIHGIHRTDWQRIFSRRFQRFTQIFTPTEFTEYTEQTGREYSPTDFTDLHRYLTPTEFTEHTEQTGREYSPTDFTGLHRYLTPTEFTEHTEYFAYICVNP